MNLLKYNQILFENRANKKLMMFPIDVIHNWCCACQSTQGQKTLLFHYNVTLALSLFVTFFFLQCWLTGQWFTQYRQYFSHATAVSSIKRTHFSWLSTTFPLAILHQLLYSSRCLFHCSGCRAPQLDVYEEDKVHRNQVCDPLHKISYDRFWS